MVRLSQLEKRLDTYGLMVDIKTTLQGQGDLLRDIYQLLLQLLPASADTESVSQLSTALTEVTDDGAEKLERAQLILIESNPRKQLQLGGTSISKEGSTFFEKIQQYENSWKLSFEDLHFETRGYGRWKVLGKGGFSIVYKAYLQLRDDECGIEEARVAVAVKKLM